MKRSVLALAVILALPALPGIAHADLAFNVGAVTDYRFRGISQTRTQPALQGGVDYTAGGFYAGAWATNIKWVKDLGGDADVEIDVYGGFTGELAKDVGYDVGVLTYQYPSNKLGPSANTTEAYGAVSFGSFKVKYSHALTNTFGNPDSKNSYYLEAGASFDVAGVAIAPHIGHQKIKGPVGDMATYTDVSLTASKDFSGVTLSLALIGTDADKSFYSSPVNGKVLGKSGVVVGAKYSF
jgi:uncharacterized protein (TIGR02001 family)